MKLPNGYGSVVKMPGKRRRPWAVRVSEKRDGKVCRKYIAFTATKEEALDTLAQFHKTPWNTDRSNATFKDVFELWYNTNDLAKNTIQNYKSIFKNYCTSLYNMPYKNLRTYHFEEIIKECNKSNGTKNTILKLFRVLDKTAIKYDIIQKSYSQGMKNLDEGNSKRQVFTKEEIDKLWRHTDIENMDIVLMLLYTGLRREELINLKLTDIDFKEWTLKGGSKTKAGKDRVIPIHPRVREFFKKRADEATGDKLFNISGNTLYLIFKDIMKEMGMKHIPHECRHTVETCLDNKNANRKCIDLIMGHKTGNTGQRVYNHKTLDQLRETILLLY